MAITNLVQFFREVRQEALKVSWPSRKETVLSTVMVVLMVLIAALFFFVVDELLALAVRLFLNLGV